MRAPARWARGARALTALAVAFTLAACGVATVNDATAGGTTRISLAISGANVPAGAGGIAAAFEKADHLSVRLMQGTQVRLNETVAVDGASGEIRVPLSVSLTAPSETMVLQLQLLQGTAPLFDGTQTLQLQAGVITPVQIALTPIPVGVAIRNAQPILFVSYGETAQARAVAVFATGDTIPGLSPTWTSLDPAVASITSDGQVTSVEEGDTRVVARLDSLADTAVVHVHAHVAAVSLGAGLDSIATGDSTTFSATAVDARGNTITGRPVTWASSNTSVAAVSTSGVVTGLALGTATITATVDSTSGSATVLVTATPPTVITDQPGNVSKTTADFQGRVNPNGSATMAWFEWSRDTAAFTNPTSSPSQSVGSGTALVPMSFSATGLAPGADYLYRLDASNGGGTRYGSFVHIRTAPDAPTAITDSASVVAQDTAAVFYGTVVANGLSTAGYIEVGFDSAFVEIAGYVGQKGVGSGSTPVNVSGSYIIYPGETLYFRTVAINSLGTSYGATKSITNNQVVVGCLGPAAFGTTPVPPPPPPPPPPGPTPPSGGGGQCSPSPTGGQ